VGSAQAEAFVGSAPAEAFLESAQTGDSSRYRETDQFGDHRRKLCAAEVSDAPVMEVS
jgi:hypothetical protein